MRIIAVDDEHPALRRLEKAIRQAAPDCTFAGFSSASQALTYAGETQVDVAFLDIDLSDMDGLTLAKNLKDLYGKTNIVFVTAHSKYALDAFSVAASGYLMKPVEPEDISLELVRLRSPISSTVKGVRIQCFGSFSLFVDEQLLPFPHAKAKELLAFLVHKNGAGVNNAEIAAVLWEDKTYNTSLQSQTRRVRGQLTQILSDAGIENILRKGWNSLAIDVDKISCDYHDFLKGNTDAINSYTGEYMSEYSWGEFTVSYLNRKIDVHTF